MESWLEFYHVAVMGSLLTLTLCKVFLCQKGLYFVKICGMTLDNMEVFPLSARYMALFTISFLAFSKYIGRTSFDQQQYNFLKAVPFAITIFHTSIQIMKHRMIFTIDDYFTFIIFFFSFALYVTFESPLSEGNIPAHIVWKQLRKQEGEGWSSGDDEEDENDDEEEDSENDYDEEYENESDHEEH